MSDITTRLKRDIIDLTEEPTRTLMLRLLAHIENLEQQADQMAKHVHDTYGRRGLTTEPRWVA